MSAASFEAPKIGSGEQIGDGNTAETLNVGRSGQPIKVQPSASGTLGFYGATPAAQRAAAIKPRPSCRPPLGPALPATKPRSSRKLPPR